MFAILADSPSDKYKRTRQIGMLTAIPMILAVAPLIGYFGGAWLDRRWDLAPLFTLIGLGIGLVAGVRETIFILRKASQDPDSKPEDSRHND